MSKKIIRLNLKNHSTHRLTIRLSSNPFDFFLLPNKIPNLLTILRLYS